MKEKMIAMLLAGGQGTRLFDLTANDSKPSVSFGGEYKIIDFTLSNCLHSGIRTIGVLTQYQPHSLVKHLGNGSPWDINFDDGGLVVLAPYQEANSNKWYLGTAHAIQANLKFLEEYNSEYTLILSGDHIYKMNYDLMLQEHIKKGADLTIAVLDVPIEEASRFGILKTDDDNKVQEFYEKPEKPVSTLASMGVYIFKTETLKKYLIEDEMDENSNHDFGQNIIPKMHEDGLNVYAYLFSGYWKDVGTIQSLWEANMDMLNRDTNFNLHDRYWKIYTRKLQESIQVLGSDTELSNAMISEGCYINGKISDSIISKNCEIKANSVIKKSVILPDARIGKNVELEYVMTIPELIVPDGFSIKGDENNIILLTPAIIAEGGKAND